MKNDRMNQTRSEPVMSNNTSSSGVPIGLQLYSVRAECAKDLAATLRSVREMGYVAAEPWGYDGSSLSWQGHSGKEMRQMFDDNSLACCGFHLTTSALMGDNFKRTVELNQILGNRYLIIAGDKPRMSSREGVKELAGILDDASEKLRPMGMYCGYHAHGFDFAATDGESPWDLLFSSTRPEVVMQLDTGNCAGGGGDPVAILRKFPGRARSVHLKEHGGPAGAVIGEGDLDWPTIFELCRTLHQPEWYVVEEETRGGVSFEPARRSIQALRRMGL
jgi:sugar phosphate isomerase/epimerase